MSNSENNMVSLKSVYNNPHFKKGLSEFVNGNPFNYDYSLAHCWEYERGRQFGVVVKSYIEQGKTTLTALCNEHKAKGLYLYSLAVVAKEII